MKLVFLASILLISRTRANFGELLDNGSNISSVLPNEMIQEIMNHLQPQDAARLGLTNYHFSTIFKEYFQLRRLNKLKSVYAEIKDSGNKLPLKKLFQMLIPDAKNLSDQIKVEDYVKKLFDKADGVICKAYQSLHHVPGFADLTELLLENGLYETLQISPAAIQDLSTETISNALEPACRTRSETVPALFKKLIWSGPEDLCRKLIEAIGDKIEITEGDKRLIFGPLSADSFVEDNLTQYGISFVLSKASALNSRKIHELLTRAFMKTRPFCSSLLIDLMRSSLNEKDLFDLLKVLRPNWINSGSIVDMIIHGWHHWKGFISLFEPLIDRIVSLLVNDTCYTDVIDEIISLKFSGPISPEMGSKIEENIFDMIVQACIVYPEIPIHQFEAVVQSPLYVCKLSNFVLATKISRDAQFLGILLQGDRTRKFKDEFAIKYKLLQDIDIPAEIAPDLWPRLVRISDMQFLCSTDTSGILVSYALSIGYFDGITRLQNLFQDIIHMSDEKVLPILNSFIEHWHSNEQYQELTVLALRNNYLSRFRRLLRLHIKRLEANEPETFIRFNARTILNLINTNV